MTNKYDDIINHPHHVSKTRPQMSMINRAAQFSAFAALEGYSDMICQEEIDTCFRVDNEIESIPYEDFDMKDLL